MVRSWCMSAFFLGISFVIGCSSGNCRSSKVVGVGGDDKSRLSAGTEMVKSDSIANRVRVFKYDGSLQCAMGKAVSLEEMQKGLGTIKVYSAQNKADGLMHIAVCGSNTGKANVYEIDRKDLQDALTKGFSEWTFD